MLRIRQANARGYADHGWLQSWHSFSFADYVDRAEMGWGNLRVINDDYIAAGAGFDTHGHRDMEIVTYVLSGALRHQDSMGNGTTIMAGEVQRMSAGTGVRHSEYNHDQTHVTHLLQIWLKPSRLGVAPGYAQQAVSREQKRGRLCAIASADGRDGSLSMVADAVIYAALLDGDETIRQPLDGQRKAYVHVARGALDVNGIALTAGDGLKCADESLLVFGNGKDAEILLFDLAA